jgi:mRNA interferase RelE/StbE
MNWKVEVKPSAEGQYRKLDGKTRLRIMSALRDLEGSTNPFFHKDVKALTGSLKGDYRLRVGNLRILFSPDRNESRLYVYAVLPRGKAY